MFSRSIAAVLVSAALSFWAAGCGGADHDALPKSFLQLLDDTTAVLKEVKDVPTAQAAEPKLKALAERKAKLDEQAKATKMTKTQLEESDKVYAEPMKYAAQKMAEELMRIGTTSPEAAQIVGEAMGVR